MANKSIFELADKFGYQSPWDNWLEEDEAGPEEKNNPQKKVEVVKIEGPYNDKDQLVQSVSRSFTYYFLISINQKITGNILNNIKWAASYDDNTKSFILFTGGELQGNKIKAYVTCETAKDKYRLYAYFGNSIDKSIYVDVLYKKTIAFFIGGAGDKKSYGGFEPNHNIEKARKPFQLSAPSKDYTDFYLGYYEVFGSTQVSTNVIKNIPNKNISSIYIIGHSLGGWNGAHLSRILSEKGYKVDMLITLDPVGTKVGVSAFFDIYWDYPSQVSASWINIRTDPDTYNKDDLVADIGGQWDPGNAPFINVDSPRNHWDARHMFTDIIDENLSASNYLLQYIRNYLSEQ